MTRITQITEELAARIEAERRHHREFPERTVIAWRGYLAGLFEWAVIDEAGYNRLVALLPEVADDPVVEILLGRDA
ncbi:MAG TPA: hypothetical protein VHE35_16495 [Kofleriaceae bacterium]|nr:hypothetical protein [Kofleriaceae bacterium]